MEEKFQYKGYIDKVLEEWLYPRGSQPNRGFFSEDQKQESTRIEGLDSEGETIINQAPEGEIYTMVVVKWSDAVEGNIVKVYGPMCGGLYKEEYGSIVTW